MEDYKRPIDTNLECVILGEMISDSTIIQGVRSLLSMDMFENSECRKIYNTIMGMYDNREEIDAINVMHRVDRDFFVNNIFAHSGTSLSCLAHIQTLRDVYLRRKAFDLAQEMLTMSQSNESSERILSLPNKIKETLEKNITISTTQSLTDVMNKLSEEWQEGKREKLPTGIPTLDKLTFGGFGAGNLVILAARPSVGKTAFMLQLARNMARRGYKTLSLSLEMTNTDLAERLVFATNELNQRDVSCGRIDWNAFERAVGAYDGCKMYFDDSASTLDEVCNAITLNNQQGKCDIAFVDYLGLMSSPMGYVKLYQQISEMTKRLKRLAMTLKIPIVVLSQLNRQLESENRPPRMSDLRDSGSIEQDADSVLMLERVKDMNGEETIIRLWVRKNRGGIGGEIYIDLHRDETYTNFYEIYEEIQQP